MAISKKLLDEINFYAKLSKERELTIEEKEIQSNLRARYLEQFKEGFKQVMDNVDVYKQLTVAFHCDFVKNKLSGEKGIVECKNLSISLTEITYDIKLTTPQSIIALLNKK